MLAALALAIGMTSLDQWTKTLALIHLDPAAPQVVTSFFNLVLRFNRGVSFGFLHSLGDMGQSLLLGLTLALTVSLLVWLCLTTSRLLMYSLGLVVGGSAGNILDRWQIGAVTDFLEFHWHGLSWPAFNLADAAICIGMGCIVWQQWTNAARVSHRIN